MPEFSRISLDIIHPSPTNPRKRFDKQSLEDLAESIRAHDVLVPLVLRPHPTLNHGSFEIVAGERRWRGAKIAGLADVPAVVRELDDKDVLEIQLIENLQRADLHPLEEAAGYEQLLALPEYTIETLADRTGRSKAYLYGRLKLTKLVPSAKKAFLEGRLLASIAELLARLPVTKLQEQALKDVLGGTADIEVTEMLEEIGVMPETVNDDAKRFGTGTTQPLSFRAAQALIHRRYSTRLELAKFGVADPQLVPEAGACTTCPHRSGYQAEEQAVLFPDLEKPADVCTNPPCFEKKTKAVWEQAKADAKERGVEVVDGDDAKEVFNYDGRASHRAPYIDPNEELPFDLQKSPGAKATWSKLLGKRASDIPTVLVQDPSGAPREMLDKRKAVEILRETGKIDKPPAKPAAGETDRSSVTKDREKEQAKRELKEGTFSRVLEQVNEALLDDLGERKGTAWMRWVARVIARELAQTGAEGAPRALQRRGVEDFDGYADLISVAKTPNGIMTLLVELLVALVGDGYVSGWNDKGARELFEEAVKLGGIDLEKAQERAKDAAKAEAQVDAAKEKKAPAKKKAGR